MKVLEAPTAFVEAKGIITMVHLLSKFNLPSILSLLCKVIHIHTYLLYYSLDVPSQHYISRNIIAHFLRADVDLRRKGRVMSKCKHDVFFLYQQQVY